MDIRERRMASSNGKPAQVGEGKAAAEGSIGGYESLHRLLEANLSPELFQVLPSLTHFRARRGAPRFIRPGRRPWPFLGSSMPVSKFTCVRARAQVLSHV